MSRELRNYSYFGKSLPFIKNEIARQYLRTFGTDEAKKLLSNYDENAKNFKSPYGTNNNQPKTENINPDIPKCRCHCQTKPAFGTPDAMKQRIVRNARQRKPLRKRGNVGKKRNRRKGNTKVRKRKATRGKPRRKPTRRKQTRKINRRFVAKHWYTYNRKPFTFRFFTDRSESESDDSISDQFSD